MVYRIISVFLALLVFFLPVAGQNEPFPFAAIGDNGCDCGAQKQIADQMLAWYKKKPFGVVLMLGDNIYGEGLSFLGLNRKGGHPGLFKDRFDDYYDPLLDSGVKFFASLGNHDIEADGGRSMIADKKRFNMVGDTGYYSFEPEDNAGLITFFAVKSTTLAGGGSDLAQVAWLKEALKKSSSTWKIVFMHHPIYSATGGHRIDVELLKLLEPIFIEGKVHVVLAGHNHFYSRTKRLDGITHFVAGGGGRSLRSPKMTPEMDKVAGRYHFMYFEASFNRLDYWAITTDGSLIDRGFIDPHPSD